MTYPWTDVPASPVATPSVRTKGTDPCECWTCRGGALPRKGAVTPQKRRKIFWKFLGLPTQNPEIGLLLGFGEKVVTDPKHRVCRRGHQMALDEPRCRRCTRERVKRWRAKA